MKELAQSIYEKKLQVEELENQIKELTAQKAAIETEISSLSDELLVEVKATDEFVEKGTFQTSIDDLSVEYFKKSTTGYADEAAVMKYLAENGYEKFIAIKKSIDKRPLGVELKTNAELKAKLDSMLTTKVSEYVVVTTTEKAERMHEHIEAGKKAKLVESK